MSEERSTRPDSIGRLVREYVPVVLTIVVGAAVSLVAFYMVRNWEAQNVQLEFEQIAENHYSAINRNLDSYTTKVFIVSLPS